MNRASIIPIPGLQELESVSVLLGTSRDVCLHTTRCARYIIPRCTAITHFTFNVQMTDSHIPQERFFELFAIDISFTLQTSNDYNSNDTYFVVVSGLLEELDLSFSRQRLHCYWGQERRGTMFQ